MKIEPLAKTAVKFATHTNINHPPSNNPVHRKKAATTPEHVPNPRQSDHGKGKTE